MYLWILPFFEDQVPGKKEFNDITFYLVYSANFDKESVESMPVFQKRYFVQKLLNQKEAESKAIEDAKK